MVVLHGLLGSSRNFRSWASNLHERCVHTLFFCDGYTYSRATANQYRLSRPRRVLVPDLRNHGSSPHVHHQEGGMTYRYVGRSHGWSLLKLHMLHDPFPCRVHHSCPPFAGKWPRTCCSCWTPRGSTRPSSSGTAWAGRWRLVGMSLPSLPFSRSCVHPILSHLLT